MLTLQPNIELVIYVNSGLIDFSFTKFEGDENRPSLFWQLPNFDTAFFSFLANQNNNSDIKTISPCE